MSNMFIFLQLWSNFCLQANSTFLSFSFCTVILQGCWQGRNSRRIHPRSSVPFDLGLWIVSPFSSGGTLWCWPGTGLERDPASPTGFSRRECCQGSSGSLRQVGQNSQPHYSFVLLFLYPSMDDFREGRANTQEEVINMGNSELEIFLFGIWEICKWSTVGKISHLFYNAYH